MWKRATKRRKAHLIAGTAVVFATFAVPVWHVLTYDVPVSEAEVPVVVPVDTPPLAAPVGMPARIRIPSIALDVAVEQVALTEQGSMDVPKDPMHAGWYALGPRPGAAGSAVVAGHVDWLDGATAAFADLRDVKPGDAVVVRDDAGAEVSFVVREIRTFDAAADARDVFVSADGGAHLNLITCDGPWDAEAGQYAERLVVFADKEPE